MMHVAVLELCSGTQMSPLQLMSPPHRALHPQGHALVFARIPAVQLCWLVSLSCLPWLARWQVCSEAGCGAWWLRLCVPRTGEGLWDQVWNHTEQLTFCLSMGVALDLFGGAAVYQRCQPQRCPGQASCSQTHWKTANGL